MARGGSCCIVAVAIIALVLPPESYSVYGNMYKQLYREKYLHDLVCSAYSRRDNMQATIRIYSI